MLKNRIIIVGGLVNTLVILMTILSQFGGSLSTVSAVGYVCTDPLGCVTIGSGEDLHIAYALTTTGPNAGLGIDSRNGVQIAIDDSGGQILGHDIQFDGQSEECSPTGGAAAGAALAGDASIVAVIGTTCSGAASAAMPFLSAAGMVMVSPSNTAIDLTEAGSPTNYPGYYRTSWSDKFQGTSAAQYAYNILGIDTASTIADSGNGYSIALQTAFADEFVSLGGTITTPQDLSGVDISTAVGNIAAVPPDLIYFPIFMPSGADVINQVRDTPALDTTNLMGSDGLYTPDVVSAAGDNVEGFLVTGLDSSQYSADYEDVFLPAYRAKFGEPTFIFHAQAYDAFMMIKAAIEIAAVVDGDTLYIGRQALRDALYATTNLSGLTGSLTCSATGDCADMNIGVFRYHAGRNDPQYFWPNLNIIKVGLVTDSSGVGNSFNALSNAGLQQAETDFGVVGSRYIPTGDSEAEFLTSLGQCVTDGNALCIASGWSLGDAIKTVASTNPGTDFAIVDYQLDAPSDNLRGMNFRSNEVGYLAGALAGKMTASNVIGDIGGMNIPPVTAFTEAYRNGAQCANPNVQVLLDYTGNFGNPADGAAMATTMIGQGADVIFAAAGPTGSGAILYSAQHEVWSIGVDVDEYLSTFGNGTVDGFDKLLSSAMKRVDIAVYQTIGDEVYDSFTPGNVYYGLSEDGVGLAPYHETDGSISNDIKNYINTLKAAIIAGTIDLNDTCPPPAPTNVKASNGTLTSKVQLTWAKSAGVTSYKIYRAISAGGAKILLGSPAANSFADSKATPGVTYYYWVKACKASNCSAFSANNSGWRKLSPPTNLKASDGTYTTKVQLTWKASAGATSYKVYRATSAGGTRVLRGSPKGTSFTDTTAVKGVTYYYWVKAYRGTRFSAFSAYNTGWRK